MALADLPAALEGLDAHPHARALLASVAAGTHPPSHAYLFHGPPGTGKRTIARAFAAALLAQGARDPRAVQERVARGTHPDLTWVTPSGASEMLVSDIDEAVVAAAARTPFEAARRVFVIEDADAMAEESQNALLKTLEEPAPFAHLILLCSDPELLAATIVSRCRQIEFLPLTPEAVLERLGTSGAEAEAAARLCGGDAELARFLLTEEGRDLRASATEAARAALRSDPEAPWRTLLEGAEAVGAEAGAAEERRLLEAAEQSGRRGRKAKLTREAVDQVKRTHRRARTDALDLCLALCGAWYRDLAAVAAGAPDLALNSDRAGELAADAQGLEPDQAAEALELVLDTRRRLRLNVSEELALDALWLRLAAALRG
jgi:DNA polymerase-3 subunit delta'